MVALNGWGCGESCLQLSWVLKKSSWTAPRPKHLSGCGVGISNRDLGCIWTWCLIACTLWWWMHTPMDWCVSHVQYTLHHSALFINFESSLYSSVSLGLLSWIMASFHKSGIVSQVRNFVSSWARMVYTIFVHHLITQLQMSIFLTCKTRPLSMTAVL